MTPAASVSGFYLSHPEHVLQRRQDRRRPVAGPGARRKESVSCWGFGRALLARLAPPTRRDAWLEAAMAAALGVGLFICAFQALAIFGVFKMGATVALVAAGVVAAVLQLPAVAARACARFAPRRRPPRRGPAPTIATIALALVALPALVAPLAPPAAFDELMYHLPYARQVAQQGSLGIHEWLRYPWFPYNYNLLYAAALQVGDDVLPHFLNALAGALSVVMVFRLGMQHANRLTACIGAAIWLGSATIRTRSSTWAWRSSC
jgi:hypothetical protein